MDHHSPGPVPDHVCVGRASLLPHLHASGQRHEHLRGGQAVDVEGRASRWPARDQCAARADGPADPDHADFAGRVPQLFYSGLSSEARGHSGPLHHGLVRGHHARHLSPFLHPILRHQPLADDRRRSGDDARRLQEVAGRLDQRQFAGPGWRAAFRQPELQFVPQHTARRPRSEPGKRLRLQAHALHRRDNHRRRRLSAPGHSEPLAAHYPGLCAHHAHLPGPGKRGRRDRAGEYIKNLDSDYRVQQTLNTTDLVPESQAGKPAKAGQPPAAQKEVKP